VTRASARGVGKARGGATDTTMLIWKVIEANPGITRAGIWERVEHDIPAGYALRSYAADMAKKGKSLEAVAPASKLSRARGFVLTVRLNTMRKGDSVVWEGDGPDRRYTVAQELTYHGNPDAIDETGTKAAEHMAVADALRTVEKMLAKGSTERKYGPAFVGGRKEYEAVTLLVRTLRAKGSA
jgi:hypothetical protein